MCGKRIMKPVKNYLKKRGKEDMKVIKGVNLIKVHYMYVWKYHNEISWAINR
jgi:hypothetical protein